MSTYFGFAVADGMFPTSCEVRRVPVKPEFVNQMLVGAISCLNPSHRSTIEAAQIRFGLEIQVPEKAPQVSLRTGDSLIVMSVRGLPRMEGRHEYTDAEIAGAEFTFGMWTVQVADF